MLDNNRVYSKGLWLIKRRQWLIFIGAAAIAVYLVYQYPVDWQFALYGILFIVLILLLFSMRSIALWKKNYVLYAENPREVLGNAEQGFLKNRFPNYFALWLIGEKKKYELELEKRLVDLKKQMIERGEELFTKNSSFHVHPAMGSLMARLFVSVALIIGGLLWFRYREIMTEKAISAGVVLLAAVWSFYLIKELFSKHKDVLVFNQHGIKIEESLLGWDMLKSIEIKSRNTLVWEKHDGTTGELLLKNFNHSPHRIEEALLYFGKSISQESNVDKTEQ